MRKGNIIGWVVAIVLVALGVVYYLSAPQEVSASAVVDEIHYEIPCLKADRSQQIIEHIGYTVSYNHDWLLPNWVAYELTSAEVEGEEQRTNKFLPDPQVSGSPVVTQDYKGSGYDRGHMAPAADMKWSAQAMRESFYMTNICPQNHNNNAGDWKSLEELARDWADKYGSIYICVGPIVEEHPQYIGNERQIAVPSAFYKAFLRRKGDDWTAIGFMMPNAAGSRPLMTYMQTINDLEEITGIDFFPNLPDSIEEQIESDYTVSDWSL